MKVSFQNHADPQLPRFGSDSTTGTPDQPPNTLDCHSPGALAEYHDFRPSPSPPAHADIL
ncbi:hypothetical protein ABJX12_002248 [Escherichia coli]|nr:hypothetical protein [Escherichia coli]EEW5405930.1 hypothetical protein [Escherichia coli]EEY7034727.1 hypothetical protein [Escherichia coli]EEY8819314.1 hypothetical protein [Escherichia coli]EEY9240119.1 hypothetical protein [Escherichia coli]